MGVAMRGDDRVAALARARRAVDEAGPPRERAPVRALEHQLLDVLPRREQLRDRPRVRPRPRRGRRAARLRALPRDLEQRLADVRFREDRDRRGYRDDRRRGERDRQRDAPPRLASDRGRLGRWPSAAERSSPVGGIGAQHTRLATSARRSRTRIGASTRRRVRRSSHASAPSAKPTTSSSGAGVAVCGSVPTKPDASKPAGSRPGITVRSGSIPARRDRRHVDGDEARVLADEVMRRARRDASPRGSSSSGAPLRPASISASIFARAPTARRRPARRACRAGRQQRAPRRVLPRRPDERDVACGASALNCAVTTIGSPAYRSGTTARPHVGAGRPVDRDVGQRRASRACGTARSSCSCTSRTSPMTVYVPRPNCAALVMKNMLGAGPMPTVNRRRSPMRSRDELEDLRLRCRPRRR